MIHLEDYIQEQNIIRPFNEDYSDVKSKWNNSLLGSFFKWLFGDEETVRQYNPYGYDYNEKATKEYLKQHKDDQNITVSTIPPDPQIKKSIEDIKTKGKYSSTSFKSIDKIIEFMQENQRTLTDKKYTWAEWFFTAGDDLKELTAISCFYKNPDHIDDDALDILLFVILDQSNGKNIFDATIVIDDYFKKLAKKNEYAATKLLMDKKYCKDFVSNLKKKQRGDKVDEKSDKKYYIYDLMK